MEALLEAAPRHCGPAALQLGRRAARPQSPTPAAARPHPGAGPEFPDAVICDPCALPPSLLDCPAALGNAVIVGELAPPPRSDAYLGLISA